MSVKQVCVKGTVVYNVHVCPKDGNTYATFEWGVRVQVWWDKRIHMFSTVNPNEKFDIR